MRTRSRNPFTTVKTAGLLLPVDLLARIAEGDRNLPGLNSESYHLAPGDRLHEAASRAWNRCRAEWTAFRHAAAKLPASDSGTTLTRERWLLPLFQELAYGRLQAEKAIQIEEKSYPVSHGWGHHVPIHLISFRHELDERTPGVAGAATRSPYSMMQELINRSAAHRWGFLSNGLKLVLLRDNASLAREANVEFDLEAMMDGEVYADFMLLFLVCHQSRLEIPPEGKPEDCWLEKWSQTAEEQGTRAREKLRDGVERSIRALGAGFLTTRGNLQLQENLRSGALRTQDYYRQLLRVVYRLLILLVAEEKDSDEGQNLFHPPATSPEIRKRYARFYSVGRLRTLASQRRGTAHTDLYESLKVLFVKLREGYSPLGIPGLGSFLFSDRSTPDLDDPPVPPRSKGGQGGVSLANEHLLDAVRQLCFTEDTSGRGGAVRRSVDFGNLGSDELGSVYESLLELQPRVYTDEGPFTLAISPGSERKTTGSHYTPTSLINCLLDSALDPVVEEALKKPNPEQALLDLKICDPACGSGHFLIAAAGRMAKHLARLRTGDDEPSLAAIQRAKRDIIGRCLYGVDINPMAVELCKVSLWMEALEPGKPLSFLDSHIQCGNSLLGATPALLENGIPDEAFTPIEGDDKKLCSEYKRQNRDERRGQRLLLPAEAYPWQRLGDLSTGLAQLDTIADDSLDGVRKKQDRYEEIVRSTPYLFSRLWADAWCTAFVWKKTKEFSYAITEQVFRAIEKNPHSIAPWMRDEIQRLARQYQFFHWHLAFPSVFRMPGTDEKPENENAGWSGGFDVVLGNPPWDALSPDVKEFFSAYDPAVRFQDKDGQAQIVKELLEDSQVAHKWETHCRILYSCVHFFKHSGRYLLFAPGNLGKGDFNVFRMFVEAALDLTRRGGYAAQIVPEGLYNGANCMAIRRSLFESHHLVSILGFENSREAWFKGVDSRTRFCIYTAKNADKSETFRAAFSLRSEDALARTKSGGTLSLPIVIVREFSPEALAIPEVRTQHDIDVASKMYSRCPKLGDSNAGPPYRDFMAEIHMGNDRELFTEDASGFPVYEGRMVSHYDHRAKVYRTGRGRAALWEDVPFGSQEKVIRPQWYIPEDKIPDKVLKRAFSYRVAICAIGSPTNERSLCAAFVPPRTVCGHSLITLTFEEENAWALGVWLAVANSFTMDFVVRQKVALNLTFTILDSLPFPRLAGEADQVRRLVSLSSALTCTSPEMIPFWDQMASAGMVDSLQAGARVPGINDEATRLNARAEIEAIVSREIYGLERNQLEYVLNTFPIVRRQDEEIFGEYRTKRVVLETYDQMAEAISTGRPYKSCVSKPSRAAVSIDKARAVLDILLLLEAWNRPVSILALEPALVLMRNDAARQALLSRPLGAAQRTQLAGEPRFIAGLDRIYDGMVAHDAIRRVGQHAFELAKPDLLREVSPVDRAKAGEVVQAISRLANEQEASDAVAELTNESYEVALSGTT